MSTENEDVFMVYVTVPDIRTAKAIARTVVTARLAACANLIPGVQSVYHWNGQLEESKEVALILKTVRSRRTALEETIRAAHPYDCPCIVHWPLSGGHPPFLKWIRDESEPTKVGIPIGATKRAPK
ncbi:MAG: divalent-cation tolerance protein CutA [Kiritimatiellia bacterium]|nr:divalent-cation tolerance protein CutA [Kiritimatiellia bacterium]